MIQQGCRSLGIGGERHEPNMSGTGLMLR